MFIIIKILFASFLEVQLFESNICLKFLKREQKANLVLQKTHLCFTKASLNKNASSPKHYSFLKDILLP